MAAHRCARRAAIRFHRRRRAAGPAIRTRPRPTGLAVIRTVPARAARPRVARRPPVVRRVPVAVTVRRRTARCRPAVRPARVAATGRRMARNRHRRSAPRLTHRVRMVRASRVVTTGPVRRPVAAGRTRAAVMGRSGVRRVAVTGRGIRRPVDRKAVMVRRMGLRVRGIHRTRRDRVRTAMGRALIRACPTRRASQRVSRRLTVIMVRPVRVTTDAPTRCLTGAPTKHRSLRNSSGTTNA